MGLGYWCFATNVCVTIFQSRLVRVPKPQWHLWKFFATGAAALTVGTVQGVIQVQPANADWLYKAGHAGEWIDPISHAHINLVTGLTMLVAGAFFALIRTAGGVEPSRRLAEHRLLRAARRLARLLLLDPLPRLPRGRPRRPPRPHAGAGRGGDGAAPVPDHGLRDRDVRGVLAAARDDRPGGLAERGPAAAVRARGLRGAGGRHAAGPGAGGAARERGPRPGRRGRRRDRQPARPAEHARRPDAPADGALPRRAARARSRVAGAPRAPDRAPGRHRDRRLLRGGSDVLGDRGASRRSRRVLRLGRLRARAVAVARARAGLAARARRVRRLRLGGVAHDRAPARSRACVDRRRAARLLGHDPAARQAAEPGGARGLRAAARADGLPGRRLALRRVPVHRLDPAAGRAGADVGGDPGRLQPVRAGAAAGCRLEGRARLAARDGAALVRPALPRPRAPPRPARGPAAARRQGAPDEQRLPRPGQRRARRDGVAARGDSVRPRARGRGREHRPLLVRAEADARGHRPVREHEAWPGEAVRLGRAAVHHARGRAPDPCAGRALAARPRVGPGRGQGVPAVRPRPGRLGRARRRESLSPRARALSREAAAAGKLRLRRHPRRDVRRARLRVPARRAAVRRRDGDQLPAARGCPGRAGRAAAALRVAARARVRGAAPALVPAPPLRREGALGPRLPLLRARRRLRGARAADRLEPGALPDLLPRGRRA